MSGADEGSADQEAVDKILKKVIETYLEHVEETLQRTESVDCGLSSQRETLSRRWQQIRLLLENVKKQV